MRRKTICAFFSGSPETELITLPSTTHWSCGLICSGIGGCGAGVTCAKPPQIMRDRSTTGFIGALLVHRNKVRRNRVTIKLDAGSSQSNFWVPIRGKNRQDTWRVKESNQGPGSVGEAFA